MCACVYVCVCACRSPFDPPSTSSVGEQLPTRLTVLPAPHTAPSPTGWSLGVYRPHSWVDKSHPACCPPVHTVGKAQLPRCGPWGWSSRSSAETPRMGRGHWRRWTARGTWGPPHCGPLLPSPWQQWSPGHGYSYSWALSHGHISSPFPAAASARR